MDLISISLVALIISALLHVFQYRQLRKYKLPGSSSVRAFVLIKLVLALMLWQSYKWGAHFAMLFSAVDFVGLLKGLPDSGTSKFIDRTLMVLDVVVFLIAGHALLFS